MNDIFEQSIVSPELIGIREWDRRFASIPAQWLDSCRYLRELDGGTKYVLSPEHYAQRGDLLLRRLKYDNSPAGLRLWSFIFSEKDRLFKAKENGWKIIAAMKDLGQIPALSYAWKKQLTFYGDEMWWSPCFAEDPALLDIAAKLGAGDEFCFVRAALGAFETLTYFPRPDLVIAAVGACCDDLTAVSELIRRRGNNVEYWELPFRQCRNDRISGAVFASHKGQNDAPIHALELVEREMERVRGLLSDLMGSKVTDDDIAINITRINRARALTARIRQLAYGCDPPPIAGLEAFLVEFLPLHYCSDPEEALAVLEEILDLCQRRAVARTGPMDKDLLRIYWVTPCTDTSIVQFVEGLGCRIAGTEYMLGQAFIPIPEDMPPLKGIAWSVMNDAMAASSKMRVDRILGEAVRNRAEGVIISGIFGASHCPYETSIISEEITQRMGIPTLSFDVPFSAGTLPGQITTRVEAFVEMLRERRRNGRSVQ
ncbi:MAG: 2-hydroxyacyl-CoA dehydratase family protein [Candidatus Brocadiia bacterium]